MRYLETLKTDSAGPVDSALNLLPKLDKSVVDLVDLEVLWAAESKIAGEKGLLEFKFESNETMLQVIERGSSRKC